MRRRNLTGVLAAAVMGVAVVAASPVTAAAPATIELGASCMSASCHDRMAKQKYVHAVAADGEQCIVCHEIPTAGRHAFKLVAEGGALCSQCHGTMVDKEYKHVPVVDGLCTFCHDPHQSDNPKQLLFPANAELCFNCHDSDEFKGATVHGPVAEGQCVRCHDPHASDHEMQLKADPPGLCFGCHNRAQKDHKGRVLLPPMTTFQNTELVRHPPFEAGLCTGCHNPHASENYRLLLGPYPETIYKAYSDDAYFCFNCHDSDAFAEPRTLDATGFRNGNLNLHYRHVNRKKGRACRACHHHHGSPNPFFIREETPFGSRVIRIRKYEKTETGGTCAPTCHREVSYDRFDPVTNVLKVTPRKGKDATPAELESARKEQLGQ